MTNLKGVKEAAEILGCSASFLNAKRITGGGPPFIKVGRSVRYEDGDLREWLSSRRRTSTSQTEAV